MITNQEVQHAIENLENQVRFMNVYAYNTIRTLLYKLRDETLKEPTLADVAKKAAPRKRKGKE